MARFRFQRHSSQSGPMLALVALGAIAGMALGVVLAERTGGIAGIKSRLRAARQKRLRDDWSDAEIDIGGPPAYSEAYAEEYDGHDDYEVIIEDDLDISDHESELEARVLEAFKNDPILSQQAIDIGAIGDGLIELTGWVHSAAEVAHALTLARGVPDVAHVVDRLAIREIDASRVGQNPEDR